MSNEKELIRKESEQLSIDRNIYICNIIFVIVFISLSHYENEKQILKE